MSFKIATLSVAVILILIALLSTPFSHGQIAGSLQVSYIDVGQGDSIWLHASDGTDIVVDGGPPSAGPTVVAYLQNTGIDDIEVMVVSHADSDHSGGLVDVLQSAIPIGAVVYNGLSSSTTTYLNLVAEMQARGLTPTPAAVGQTYSWGPIIASVLNPQSTSTGDQNEDSVVLLVSYGNKKFLFTGDIGSSGEQTIVASGMPMAADVLKVAHHGSKYSSGALFLNSVKPQVAVISVGANNSYGHPAQETIDRLSAVGARVLRTDQRGTIVISTDGQTLEGPLEYLVFVPLAMKSYPPVPTATPSATLTATPIAVATATSTATTSPTSTPTATPVSNQADLHITDLSYAGSDEYVQVTNHGSGMQNMTGWRLHSVVGDQWYDIPGGYTLGAGATVRVHSGASAVNNPPTDLLWGYAYIWNNAGDKAVLYNATNQIIASSCYLAGCP